MPPRAVPADERLTSTQLEALVLLERVGGAISLVAVLLIFLAYGMVRHVRNVQNTFIVFASVSNVGASVASIIAMDGLRAGRRSALCQAQSFMFEMFMQSDPWWSLAMAINVFLVFYFRTSPDSFRKWWWLYCAVCYGGPFIISLALLLVKSPTRGPIYGGATIWCWVDQEWDDIRIYTYYMLVWICIAGSLLFYFMVGYHVFHSRNQLRSLSASNIREPGHLEDSHRMKLPSVPQDGFYGTVITEVQVTHTNASPGNPTSAPEPLTRVRTPTTAQVSFDEAPAPNPSSSNQYFSTVTSTPAQRSCPTTTTFERIAAAPNSFLSKFVIEDHIKRAYLRTSFLFALSVLVTWIPSSLNRIHSWLQGESPVEYHVATAAVLPLQGLWNAVIFFVTSAAALKSRARDAAAARYTCDGVDTFRSDDVIGGRGARAARDPRGDDSDLDDADSGALGSDVELRRMAESPGKRSSSL